MFGHHAHCISVQIQLIAFMVIENDCAKIFYIFHIALRDRQCRPKRTAEYSDDFAPPRCPCWRCNVYRLKRIILHLHKCVCNKYGKKLFMYLTLKTSGLLCLLGYSLFVHLIANS